MFSVSSLVLLCLNYVEQHGQIKRGEVVQLCRVTKDQAARLLRKLHSDGRLVRQGQSRATYYVLPVLSPDPLQE